MIRERVAAAFGVIGMIMLIVTVRVWIGTPGPAFWCAIAALTFIGLGIVLAYTQIEAPAQPTVEPAEHAATVTVRPDYVDQPVVPAATVTSRPPSPFAPGGVIGEPGSN